MALEDESEEEAPVAQIASSKKKNKKNKKTAEVEDVEEELPLSDESAGEQGNSFHFNTFLFGKMCTVLEKMFGNKDSYLHQITFNKCQFYFQSN